MRRSQLYRDSLRRADTGVDSIEVNDQPPGGITGPVEIVSPMAEFIAPNIIRIDNGNSKDLPAAPVSADINTDLNTAFRIAKLAAAATVIPIPQAPANLAQAEDRKITFEVRCRGVDGDIVTWTGGAGGYLFANALSEVGVTQAQFDALLAAADTTDNAIIKIGFSYCERLNRWLAVALAGWFV